MERDELKTAVRTTLMLLSRLAKRTSTQADDLMASILRTNEDRLVDAVLKPMSTPDQPLTEERMAEALRNVGIKV